jgi:hypothetical protein
VKPLTQGGKGDRGTTEKRQSELLCSDYEQYFEKESLLLDAFVIISLVESLSTRRWWVRLEH